MGSRRLLIPTAYEADLADVTTNPDVVGSADRIGIAPGIVVGRLPHGGRWPQARGNHLKQTRAFPEEPQTG